MSRISVSKSFAVLTGMESYIRTKRKVKEIEGIIKHRRDKMLHPEKVKLQDEGQKDKSQSAEKERQHLETVKLEEEKERLDSGDAKGSTFRIATKLGLRPKEDG